jgi:hypothetical protein
MERLIYDIIDKNIVDTFANPTLFVPSNNYNVKTNISSIIKFLLYSGIIIFILTQNWKLVIVILVFIIVLKFFSKKAISFNEKLIEKNKQKNDCKKSTLNNPTGNVLLYDSNEILNKEFCPLQEKEMDDNIKYNFYFDSKDIWQSKNYMRSFITMPSQTHPNNLSKFTSYLYNFDAPTCKINGVNCMFNEDVRYHKNTFLEKKIIKY